MIPPGIEIAPGLTCTVNLETPKDITSDTRFLLHWLKANLFWPQAACSSAGLAARRLRMILGG